MMQRLGMLQTSGLENQPFISNEDAARIAGSQKFVEPSIDSPEARLILACSRTCINLETYALIEELLQEDLDWVYLIKTAQTNGVTPLLCHNLLNRYAEFIPQKYLDWLKRFSKEHAGNNLYQTMELLKVIRLLENQNIPTLPFKGPTLAAQIYGDVGLRQFCDLDILVHRKNVGKSLKILAEQGYHPTSPPAWSARFPTLVKGRKDVALVNEKRSVRIELHWRLSGTHFNLPVRKESLWMNLKTVALASQPVRTLPLDDSLLYLTLHGSRHGWMRLAWICDIAELLRIHQSVDWQALLLQAGSLGCERTLLLGLLLANRLLQTPLPEIVREKIEADRVIRPIATRVGESLFNKNEAHKDISYWSRYHLEMKERWRERVRVRLHYYYRYFHLAITPNEKDLSILALPGSLRFLYYLMRPLRFSRDYGARWFRRDKKSGAAKAE
jgi:hypothetical protein